MNLVYPRYLNNFGRSFLFPEEMSSAPDIPKLLNKGGDKDKKQNMHKFRVARCDFSPIQIFRDQVVADIDNLIEANEARPDVLITCLHTLILNKSSKEPFDPVIEEKLIGDYFLGNPVFLRLLEESKISASKSKVLAKCMRYL
jgi:hypothetical protein